jgi:autotransporter strand-loop-strand O-heptosyltransferase
MWSRSRTHPDNSFHVSFVDGAFLEIVGPVEDTYRVDFIDTTTNAVVHQDRIPTNHWIRTARQYFTDWRIDAYRARDDAPVFSHRYACRGRRVYIAVESKAVGDTLAWFPSIEAFRQRHGCAVICSTFMNDLFRTRYSDLTFVEPGTTVHDLYAMYRLGWFYLSDGRIDHDRNVRDFRCQPLGESAFDILGLPYVETRPRIAWVDGPRPIDDRYVCIAVHATAQAKYWNNPDGWAQVVRFLRQKGYRVLLLSREGPEYMGNKTPDGVTVVPEGPMDRLVRYLLHASMFIGVASGLAWLAWTVGCRTCLVSGFSLPYTEMTDCIRIFPRAPAVCTGCFNRYRLDPGDWNWCPEHKDTPRMFECTREITGDQVIEAIRDHL